jgi:hypothetical protein
MAGLDNLLGGLKQQGESFKNVKALFINKEEIVSKYVWEFDKDTIDDETLNFLKEQTVKIHNASNNFYTELGKIFKEAQEKLANHGDGVFSKWIENIGFKRANVYRYISRYNFISSLSAEKQEKAEALPLKVSYEVLRNVYTDEIKEKVFSGEITKLDELKKFSTRKEVKNLKKEISSTSICDEIKEILDLLAEKESRLKNSTNSDIYEKLKKVKNLIKDL